MATGRPVLCLTDLRACARNYRWYRRGFQSLLREFKDPERRILPLLAQVDRWVSGGRPATRYVRLSEEPVLPRLDSLMGRGTTVEDVREVLGSLSTPKAVQLLASKILGAGSRPVDARIAFPLTVLLRCIDPHHYCIMATPHDMVSGLTPYEWQRDRIEEQHAPGQQGISGLEAWDSIRAFAQDYDAYSAWLRRMSDKYDFATPGEIDDGVWQLSRCLAGPLKCPGARGRDAVCETGRLAMKDEEVRRRARMAQAAIREGASRQEEARQARFALFRLLLERSGEDLDSPSLRWEDLARFLMPEPAVVELLFSDSTRRATGSRGGKMLGWLEAYFGHFIVDVLRAKHGTRPGVIGKHLDTHATAVRRRLKAPPLPGRKKR